MLSRGYSGEPRVLDSFKIKLRDCLWLCIGLVICAFLLNLNYGKIIFDLKDVHFSYLGKYPALCGIDLQVEEASKRRYGPLTAELKRMVAHMSWGKSFEEALQSFSERVNTSLTKRSIPLVIEASHSGGRVEKVFEPTGKFVQSTLLAEKERQAQTRPYVAIVYVAFFVFLFTVIMLFTTFFVQMSELAALNTAVMSTDEARRLFFHMSTGQAFFGGLVAGKMGEGTMSAGLKHSVILLVAGYIALKLLI
jgi:flagellar protein FlaJ